MKNNKKVLLAWDIDGTLLNFLKERASEAWNKNPKDITLALDLIRGIAGFFGVKLQLASIVVTNKQYFDDLCMEVCKGLKEEFGRGRPSWFNGRKNSAQIWFPDREPKAQHVYHSLDRKAEAPLRHQKKCFSFALTQHNKALSAVIAAKKRGVDFRDIIAIDDDPGVLAAYKEAGISTISANVLSHKLFDRDGNELRLKTGREAEELLAEHAEGLAAQHFETILNKLAEAVFAKTFSDPVYQRLAYFQYLLARCPDGDLRERAKILSSDLVGKGRRRDLIDCYVFEAIARLEDSARYGELKELLDHSDSLPAQLLAQINALSEKQTSRSVGCLRRRRTKVSPAFFTEEREFSPVVPRADLSAQAWPPSP